MRRYSRVLGVAFIILIGEIAGGLFSGSLALLADAAHVFADNIAIIVSIVVIIFVKMGSRERIVRGIGFYTNVTLLGVVVVWILLEALARYQNPPEIISWVMVTVATIGAGGNWLQHYILKNVADDHRHQTHRVLSLHILSDLFLSLGVIMGGIIIWTTGWMIVDPIISVCIALWITHRTIQLVRDPHGNHNLR